MSLPDHDPIEVETDLLIPMRDGVRLAATLYRPAGGGRRPCLVNYIPYHKDGRIGLWYDANPGAELGHPSRQVEGLPIASFPELYRKIKGEMPSGQSHGDSSCFFDELRPEWEPE